ncbi:hypothetical protein HN362_02190 [bacterium]|jgi:hypothetical protein|nr:hypothetical protein [bacterium]MBT3581085.1 hypothetical protein [bacterium]
MAQLKGAALKLKEPKKKKDPLYFLDFKNLKIKKLTNQKMILELLANKKIKMIDLA